MEDNLRVKALMRRCQVGVGGSHQHALEKAHEIMADCYGTLGRLLSERDAAVARAEAAEGRRPQANMDATDANALASLLGSRVAELERDIAAAQSRETIWVTERAGWIEDCQERAARVAELEVENAQARSLLAALRRPYLPDGTARAVEAAADAFLAGATTPRTRRLTTADRLPERGDWVKFLRLPRECSGSGIGGASFLGPGGWLHSQESLKANAYPYISRADGGPITVTEGEA